MIKHNIENSVKSILAEIEEYSHNREGLIDTPRRVAKAYAHIFGGYDQNPFSILSTSFVEGSCEEMVILKDIEFYSMCEHHMLPFFGTVHIGYIPNGKVVGVSKLARLVDCFARRLQIQEKFTGEIADTIKEALNAKGVIVVVEAEHLCMKMRGVEKKNTSMLTTAYRGVFKQSSERRKEFFDLLKGGK